MKHWRSVKICLSQTLLSGRKMIDELQQAAGTIRPSSQKFSVCFRSGFDIGRACLNPTLNAMMSRGVRYLSGAIPDWPVLFARAFRTCRPGGWAESCERDVEFLSDDETTDPLPALETGTSSLMRMGRNLAAASLYSRTTRSGKAWRLLGL